jgi:hypothetical protein
MIRSEQQVLITGCYRSGTEYITLLLNNHPKLSASMYVVSFLRFSFNRYDPVDQESNYARLLTDAAERIRGRYEKELNVQRIIEECRRQKTVTHALLYDLMMSDLFLSNEVRRWAEKVQLVWTKIPAFLEMFPAGKAIHVVRDPRSVLASFKKITYAPEPEYLGAIFNCYDSMKKGLGYRKACSTDRYLLLKFEDLIGSPKEHVVKMFDFLGLSSDHDLLSEEGWTDASGKPWSHNSAFMSQKSKGRVSDKRPFLDRWKDKLAPWEIDLCETVHRDLMPAYGYEPVGDGGGMEEALRVIFSHEKLTRYYRRWLDQKEGVEEFPTDPLNPKNWTENAPARKSS